MIGATVSFLPGSDDPRKISRHLFLYGAAAEGILQGRIRVLGQDLLQRVQANAPKRTGLYADSIGLEIVQSGVSVTAYVGTNHPAGRRLELGFEGVDSAGRRYSQPPQPHFGPAASMSAQQVRDYIKGW